MSRDVKFFNHVFPYLHSEDKNLVPENEQNGLGINLDLCDYYDTDLGQLPAPCVQPLPMAQQALQQPETAPTQELLQQAAQPVAMPITSTAGGPATCPPVASPAIGDDVPQSNHSTTADAETDENMGRGFREKYSNVRYRDYVTHTVFTQSPSPDSPTPTSQPPSGMPYPIAHYVSGDKFSVKHRNFIASVTAGKEPTSFKKAMKDDELRKAIQEEISALENNGTWVMEYLPPGKKALGSKWVYKIKFKSDGSIERLKARLVVFGNHQVEGMMRLLPL